MYWKIALFYTHFGIYVCLRRRHASRYIDSKLENLRIKAIMENLLILHNLMKDILRSFNVIIINKLQIFTIFWEVVSVITWQIEKELGENPSISLIGQ